MIGRLRVEPFGDEVEVAPDESLLASLLRHGRYVQHGCKHGGCGTCRAQLVEGVCRLGTQTSFSLSHADRENGMVLLCATYLEHGDAIVDVAATMEQLTHEDYMAGQRLDEETALVEAVDVLSPALWCVRLRLARLEALRFRAGQYVEVEVPGSAGTWRSYSLASAPGQRPRVELLVTHMPGGRFSGALADGTIAPGTSLRVRGPLGQFQVRLSHRPMVMIAGGSGLAPLRAMVHDLVARGNQRAVTLFQGARRAEELVLQDELHALARAHAWLRVIPVVSEPEAHWAGETGLVTEAVARLVPSLRDHEVYVAGPPGLIDATLPLAAARGCKPRHVYFDRFVPTG